MSLVDESPHSQGASLEPKKEIKVKIGDLREEYNVKEEVGRGKFGVVHKVIGKHDGFIYAAKFIKVTAAKRKNVFHEVDIMKKLHHENLVSLTDVFDMQTRIIVIMEFISGGELFERVVEEDNLTEAEAAIYMQQILGGLQHMHKKSIVHLDLKPENVVCVQPKSTRIKLIDFGLAQQLEPGKETKITCGTPEFVAPEVLSYDPVTLASDMWSVGVIAYVLLSGLSPFLGDTDSETFANVTACEWDFDDECFDEVSSESKDFIEGLIVHKPRDRRSVDLCLEHDWIQNHSWKKKKKLNIENLRKFLAKKRWQRSVNAVRAIRRLSSFGATLLGKTGSLLGNKKRLGSIDSPDPSIAEDCEHVTSREANFTEEANEVEGDGNNLGSVNASKPNAEQSVIERKRNSGKKTSDHDVSRTLANISQLRQKFETISDRCGNLNAVTENNRNEKERRLRANSLDFECDRNGLSPGSCDFSDEDASENLQSKALVRGSKLVAKGDRSMGNLSKSTESLIANGYNPKRSRKISLESVGSAVSKEKCAENLLSRIPGEDLRDGKKALNGEVSRKGHDLQSDDEIIHSDTSIDRKKGQREGAKRNSLSRRPSAECVPINDGGLQRGTVGIEPLDAFDGVTRKEDIGKDDFKGSKRRLLTDRSTIGEVEINRGLERGSRDERPLIGVFNDVIHNDIEGYGRNNEPRSGNRDSVTDVNRNVENGEFACEKATAVPCAVNTVKKSSDTRLSSARSVEGAATKQAVGSCVVEISKEEKAFGVDADSGMPHKRDWCKSSAAAKRASFRELLSKSIAADEKEEEDDVDSGDEEPIKIETRKDKFDDFFEDIEEIGRGRFGIVSKVREKATGKFFAAKYIKVRAATRCIVRQEIELLCAVRHKRIVKLYDVFEESRKFILVLEWVAGGELFEKLSKEEIISEKEAVFFIKQILQGVRCMHKKGILHLDLKPENVMLVDLDSTDIKIIDFGLAKWYNPKEEIKVLSGTPAFAAPEVINFEMITAATDMWSVGVIAYVLMSGISPFMGEDNQETCSNVTKARWDFDHPSFESISPEAKDFISKLIVRNPRERMTISNCLQHTWIKSAKKRRKSNIKTSSLFRFTKSFSKSVDQADEVFTDSPQAPMPSNGTKSPKTSDSDANAKENVSSKASKQPVFQVINTMDESSSDNPVTTSIDHSKSYEDYRVLEERFKNMEKDHSNIKGRLRKQVELQSEMEVLHSELEKSLQAHKKLQDSILVHEEERAQLKEVNDGMKSNVNKLEMQNEELLQKLEIVNENYEKLGRKYNRLQEKLEKNEDLEDRIEELERTKARKIDKIQELEDLLSDVKENRRKSARFDDTVKMKLEKENRSLQGTVEGCHQEIEELEDRLGSVERENSKLRSELKQLRNASSHLERDNKFDNVLKEKMEKLEELRTDLEEQLAIEVRDRKLAEKERDTIEEEFAEERSNLECRIEKVLEDNAHMENEIAELTSLLDASKKSFFQLDEEFQELKREKGTEKRQHILEIKEKEDEVGELVKEKETLKAECRRLDKKMAESIEEIRRLESDKSLRESHGTVDRRSSGSSKELERVKEDLKMTQDHLRIATDTNSLLQLEVKKLKKDYETELNIQLIELEAKLSKGHEAEMDRVREELTTLPNKERKELEDRITVQDFAIRKLQAILEVRENEERRKSDSSAIMPLTVNGTRNSPPLESVSTKALPDSVNVTISPGRAVKVAQSMDIEDDDDQDGRDVLTDRELRRLSYKIADGIWDNMGQALCLRGTKYEETMGGSYNDQEKVFRLLTLWKSEMKQPRTVMISQLTVAMERMKRRDVVKFVKELNGREGSSMSIRKRIRNFVR